MKYFILLLSLIAASHADKIMSPILWERSFSINASDINALGVVNKSTSYMVTSQDFQSIIAAPNSNDVSERIVYNFGESCLSSNLTVEKVLQMNYNGIEIIAPRYINKLALVKRGGCNWSEKFSVINKLKNISVTAIFIYDNISYGDEIEINKLFANSSGYLELPTYLTPLPAYRSVLNMSDNDMLQTNYGHSTVVYFIPNIYGQSLINQINQINNTLDSYMKDYRALTPYLENISWGSNTKDGSLFKLSTNYIAYIVSCGAIFIFGIIIFRYWTLRQSRNNRQNDTEMQTQRRRSRLDPLPVDIVNRLPVDKYSKDLLKNETCVICLEDFTSGKDDVRILPCGHGFCVLCIDPWFTQKSCLCPICKWDCLPIDIRNQRDLEKKLYNENRSLAREGQDDNNSESNNTVGNEPGSSTGRNSYVEDHNSTLLSIPNAPTIIASSLSSSSPTLATKRESVVQTDDDHTIIVMPSDLNGDTNTHEPVSTDNSLTNTNNEQSNSSTVDLSNHTDKKEERN